MAEAPEVHHEIVIIRRGHGEDHEGHHGGVWKIAFADFMTALMAFFLVLWIVNSSSKATKSAIARYFNPIQLTDSTPARRGLRDAKEVDSDASGENAQPGKPDAGKSPIAEQAEAAAKSVDPHAAPKKPPASQLHDPEEKSKTEPEHNAENHPPPKPKSAGGLPGVLRAPIRTEAVLFRDPYAVLAEIAATSEDDIMRQPFIDGSQKLLEGTPGLNADEKFRDPFEPVAPVMQARPASEPDLAGKPGIGSVKGALAAPPGLQSETAGAPIVDLPKSGAFPPSAKLMASLNKALLGEGADKNSPQIELKTTQEGILISLTDSSSFGMFAVGSSEPDAKVVKLLAKVGDALKSNPGSIVVRGYTDSRKYRNGAGDNWRLSASRAQMAFYMLTRNGLPEARFDRIEGHADHSLKRADTPDAPENRRIEILLRNTAP